MTDAEYIASLSGAIITAGGIVGTAIRFAASRIIKAMDRSTEVTMKQVESQAVLATKLDGVISWLESVTPPMGNRVRGGRETDPPAVPIQTQKKTRFGTKPDRPQAIIKTDDEE